LRKSIRKGKRLFPGLLQSHSTDSNRRPPPYHALRSATGRNPRQRFSSVFRVLERGGHPALDSAIIRGRGARRSRSLLAALVAVRARRRARDCSLTTLDQGVRTEKIRVADQEPGTRHVERYESRNSAKSSSDASGLTPFRPMFRAGSSTCETQPHWRSSSSQTASPTWRATGSSTPATTSARSPSSPARAALRALPRARLPACASSTRPRSGRCSREPRASAAGSSRGPRSGSRRRPSSGEGLSTPLRA